MTARRQPTTRTSRAPRTGHAEPAARASHVRRLKRIEGQVRGLQRMVEEDRYCPDIIAQIAAVQEALRGVGRQLLRHHLSHCATDAIRKGPDHAARTYDELLELVYRHLR
jgi:DNA-binding FrmR family transcriptional regulator